MPDLTAMGNGSGSSGGSSAAEFLKQLRALQSDQEDFEERLNRLKISNVQNLGNLQKQKQEEVANAYTKALLEQNRLIEQRHKKERAQIRKEAAEREKLDDAAFKKKYGKTKKESEKENKARLKQMEAEEKMRKKYAKEAASLAIKDAKRTAITGGKSTIDKLVGFRRRDVKDENGNVIGQRKANPLETIASLGKALGDMAKQLDSTINTVAGYKGAVDTRLQGSKMAKNWAGSYWEKMSSDITGIAGVSPLLKQSAVAERVNQMVSQGIAFNVEQRAVIQELSGKIATTFDAANGTLLRLVRIQQQDTTAGRLGMESALTAFLNNMYETTEYMSSIATSIKGSLEEAMSLMSGENALSFEYQVQKWLGSMYSVGMSDTAVQGLGGVLGKLASGQIDAITNGGQGNLIVMAANQAGLSVADLMSNGLNADTTNQLMNSMVEYLAKIYEEAGDSKVIQQQMASVYGMTASDLKAAVNLAKSAGVVSRDGLTYSAAMGRLNSMANSMYSRTSVGEMMTNAWDNLQYTMAAGIGNNPALYAMYKAAGLLDTVAGGIAIPAFSVMGNMVDLETSVADLMRAGAMGGSILSGIGAMIASGGNGGITGSGILRAAGIGNGISTVTRGNGAGLSTAGGATVSESGSMVGNSSGSDVQSKTMTDANDSGNSQLASAVDATEETKLKDVHSEVINIYHLLQDIATGTYTIPVDVKNSSLKVDMGDLGL